MSAFPEIERNRFRTVLKGKALAEVQAAPEGRFILPVPALDDGEGPILAPNIKELLALMRGSEGKVRALKLEAGPQKIPADGTNIIVINRVDEFVQFALLKKLESILKETNGKITRKALNKFMCYARGYDYLAETQEIIFEPNAGFHNDVYNMPVTEFRKRYEAHNKPGAPLLETVTAGYYVKKPLHSHAYFVKGSFSVRVAPEAGETMQEFDKGAMVNLPDDDTMPLSFIHPTDIDTCYRMPDGGPLRQDALPAYDAALFLQDDAKRRSAS